MNKGCKWTKEKCHEAALKYNKKIDFIKLSYKEYRAAARRGWLSDICSHMVETTKPAGFWNNKENIKKVIEESKINSITHLKNEYPAAIQSIRVNGWLDEFFPKRIKHGYWGKLGKEEIRIKAAEYKNQSEFQQKCKPAYELAKQNGWLHEFYIIKKRGLTYDECKDIVGNYSSYSELYQQDVSVLTKIRSKGWENLISHWELPISSRNPKWTYERCKEEIDKFKYLNDLQGTSVLGAIKKNGWYDELTSNLIREAHAPYTKEEVFEAALKYQTRNDFRVKCPGQYGAAKRLGIMSEVTSHMGISLNKKQYTKQEILDSASKYTNQRDWLNNEPSIYRCACGYNKTKSSEEDKKFFKECVSHMEYIFKPNGYWTYERCKEISLKYNSLKEFRENPEDASVYSVINKNGWKELFEHMEMGRKPYGYWTYERCKEVALKYKSRSEFSKSKNDCTAYHTIHANEWFELLNHMKRKMTLKKRHIYVYEFSQSKVAYIGLSCQIKRRHDQHMGVEYNKTKSPVLSYMEKTGESPLFKVLTRRPLNEENAPHKEDECIKKYKQDGWVMLNKAKAGSLGGTYKWTYEKIVEIAKTCKTMKEFNKKIPSWAKKNITKEQLYELTKDLYKETTTWTYEKCKEVANNCRFKREFQKKYSGAYKFAIKTNILNDLFPHTYNDLRMMVYNDYEKFMELGLRYDGTNEFSKKHRGYYKFACKNGWINELTKIYAERRKEKLKSRKYSNKLKRSYTKEDILNSSQKYMYKTEWLKADKKFYKAAKKYEWFDEATAHMKKYEYKSKYDLETCKKLANTCRNKSEFQEKYSGAHKYLLRNNLYKVVFPN